MAVANGVPGVSRQDHCTGRAHRGGGGKGEALDIDLYAFPLGKYDMVLGV